MPEPQWLHRLEDRNNLVHSAGMLARKWSASAADRRIESWARKNYSKNPGELSQWRDRYTGQRCFILATGPSLTISDCEKLGNEYTFGMNSLTRIFKDTDWRPSFYGIQDWNVYRNIADTMEELRGIPKFFSDDIIRNDPSALQMKLVVPFVVNAAYHRYSMYTHEYFARFSERPDIITYDGYTITYSLLEIAVFLGFKEIYLLGADCDYSGSHQHIVESGNFVGQADFSEVTKRLFAAYRTADEYCRLHGVQIFNATRGGKLEIFPRVDLDQVVSA